MCGLSMITCLLEQLPFSRSLGLLSLINQPYYKLLSIIPYQQASQCRVSHKADDTVFPIQSSAHPPPSKLQQCPPLPIRASPQDNLRCLPSTPPLLRVLRSALSQTRCFPEGSCQLILESFVHLASSADNGVLERILEPFVGFEEDIRVR